MYLVKSVTIKTATNQPLMGVSVMGEKQLWDAISTRPAKTERMTEQSVRALPFGYLYGFLLGRAGCDNV